MPRKKLVCALPRPRRPRGSRNALDDRQLLEILRRLALAHQRAEPQLFYPLRDAARELGVSLSAISRAYEALKKEGVLGTIRASRTVIEGRAPAAPISFKGFIGLPVSLSCFLTLQDYRDFYFALRRESLRRGFVSNLLFFTDDAAGLDELSRLVKEFGVHVVIWFLPRLSAQDVILSLKDQGVRFVGIRDGASSASFCRYEIRREHALSRVFRKWAQEDHIDCVTTLCSSSDFAADEEMIQHGIERAGLSYHHLEFDPRDDPETILARLAGEAPRGVVLPGGVASQFSLRAPEAFAQVMRRCRILLPDGPMPVIPGSVPRGQVDLLAVDWAFVVKCIVHDVTTKRAFEEARPVVFAAEARFAVNPGGGS
jgi:DNA-binding Lrp family transcriptional regulator